MAAITSNMFKGVTNVEPPWLDWSNDLFNYLLNVLNFIYLNIFEIFSSGLVYYYVLLIYESLFRT